MILKNTNSLSENARAQLSILKTASNWKEPSIHPVFPVGIQDEGEISLCRSFPANKWRRNGIITKSPFGMNVSRQWSTIQHERRDKHYVLQSMGGVQNATYWSSLAKKKALSVWIWSSVKITTNSQGIQEI